MCLLCYRELCHLACATCRVGPSAQWCSPDSEQWEKVLVDLLSRTGRFPNLVAGMCHRSSDLQCLITIQLLDRPVAPDLFWEPEQLRMGSRSAASSCSIWVQHRAFINYGSHPAPQLAQRKRASPSASLLSSPTAHTTPYQE